jgi:hypothetical protein
MRRQTHYSAPSYPAAAREVKRGVRTIAELWRYL